MLDFATLRFDDRILRIEDDGRDFEQFVAEYLRLKHGEDLVRGLARGADGAIDLINAVGPIRDVVECKFISVNATDSPAKRWGEVRVRLKKNLRAAAEGKGGPAIAYRPWLRSNGPVERYRFCTSALMGTGNDRNLLRDEIETFFSGISHEHAELEHLAKLKVEVLSWDDFTTDVSVFPQLFYRWFGGLPRGAN